jgi:hypothetical protein
VADPVVIKAKTADGTYQGTFGSPAFSLLANPVALYDALLKQLGPHGARLDRLKFDGSVLAEAHVSCSLPELSTMVEVRIDRLQVTFLKLHEMLRTAPSVLNAAWSAVQQASRVAGGPPTILHHVATINIQVALVGTTYVDVISRFVNVPEEFGRRARAAVGFTVPSGPNGPQEDLWSQVTLDKSLPLPEGLYLRFSLAMDGQHVGFDEVPSRFDRHVRASIQHLGFSLTNNDE